MDVFHRDFLLALATVTIERFEQHGACWLGSSSRVAPQTSARQIFFFTVQLELPRIPKSCDGFNN
jgi:hypothetical protein